MNLSEWKRELQLLGRIMLLGFISLVLCISVSKIINRPSEENIYICDRIVENGAALSYETVSDVPVLAIAKDKVRLFSIDYAYYAPSACGGQYWGTLQTYGINSIEQIDRPATEEYALLPDGKRYKKIVAVSESLNSTLTLLESGKEIWVSDGYVTYHYLNTDNYQLKELNSDGTELSLVDSTIPQPMYMTSSAVTRTEILEWLEGAAAKDGVIVATKYDQTEHVLYYIEFEFKENKLRARTEYCFFDSDQEYEANKLTTVTKHGLFNDNLRLLRTSYGYEVELNERFRGLTYEQMKQALQADDFILINSAMSVEEMATQWFQSN